MSFDCLPRSMSARLPCRRPEPSSPGNRPMPEPRCHVNMFFMTWTSLLKCQPNIPVRGADSPTLLNRVAPVGQTISASVELAPKQWSTMFLAKSLKTLDCGGSPAFGCTCGPLPAHMTITCQNRFQTLHHLICSFQITVHPFLKRCPLILITLGQIGQTCQSGAWKAHPCCLGGFEDISSPNFIVPSFFSKSKPSL